MLPEWHTPNIIKKLEKPILTPADIPYKSTCVYNAGVTKMNGKYIMAFRNDYGDWGKKWGLINHYISIKDSLLYLRLNHDFLQVVGKIAYLLGLR